MVEARYQGKPVSSLPEEAFAEGLSRSGLSPVLLLASPTTVPVTTDERWWLAKENVSGHYGRIFYFTMTPARYCAGLRQGLIQQVYQ